MTNSTAFDWRPFLLGWSGEWADALTDEESGGQEDEESRDARWLGFPPASGERIADLERRLGVQVPPSYRAFLEVSDGWRHAGGFVSLLAGTQEVCWHNDASRLAEMFEEHLDDDAGPQERTEVEIWHRGLQLHVESDATYVVMDPEDVDEDGEWAVYTWASWRAEPPRRYASFRAFMRDMHREFHSLRAHGNDHEREFVNETTRLWDSRVEEARLDALAGDWEGAVEVFDEARGYGRPRAAGLRDQIRRLLGETYMTYYEGLATNRRYASELLPALIAGHTAHSHGDDSTLKFHLRGADAELTAQAHAMLDPVRSGTYRYEPGGAFGEAVGRARELARWGETDGAWRALIDALPLWEPLGPDLLAPLGWVAEPVLGRLLVPERGRELLATPRAGRTGVAPPPVARLDPDGMAWLAEPDPGNNRTSYRFVLVEGVEPTELPGRLSDDGDEALDEPAALWEMRRRRLEGQRESSSFEDKALAAVGRAGTGWSFAFDGDPAPFLGQRFISPAAGASVGTRSVVVWSGLRSWHGEPYFHLSVARDGVEQYAFTYADGEVRRSGEIPAPLEPSRFFGDCQAAAAAEGPLLDALACEFGVQLPRYAIVHGRLHTFTTRSWTRPPGEGETYMVIRMNWS